MPTDDRNDAAASLRRMVDEESARQRQDRDAVERAERERHAAAAAEVEHAARERAEAERESSQLIALFLDAMRRAGNPGLEELRLNGETKRKWWNNEIYRVPGPPLRGWALREAWDNGESKPDYRRDRPGVFLSASGDVLALGSRPEGILSKPHDEERLVDERLIAQCLAHHGVTL